MIAGVIGWADLTWPDVAEQIKAPAAQPGGDRVVGMRHRVQSEPEPHWLTRPEAIRGLEAVADTGLVYDLVITSGQLSVAADAAETLPDLVFILDHLGKPPIATGMLEPWRTAVKRLAALANTVCKLSGMVTEADWHSWKLADLRPYAETVLDPFGPDRLMFGSCSAPTGPCAPSPPSTPTSSMSRSPHRDARPQRADRRLRQDCDPRLRPRTSLASPSRRLTLRNERAGLSARRDELVPGGVPACAGWHPVVVSLSRPS